MPLTGAEFTLERLKASVTANGSGGYDYELQVDENGDYLPDETFVVRTVLTGQDGRGKFEHLPAGYYRLTETQCPEGYTGLSGPVILFAPYQGEAYIVSTPGRSLCQRDTDRRRPSGDGAECLTVQHHHCRARRASR